MAFEPVHEDGTEEGVLVKNWRMLGVRTVYGLWDSFMIQAGGRSMV